MRSTFFCPRLGHIWATNLYDYGVKRAIGSQPRAGRINTGYVSDMPVTHEVAGSSSVIPTREFGLYHAQCWLPADRTVTKTSTSPKDRDWHAGWPAQKRNTLHGMCVIEVLDE